MTKLCKTCSTEVPWLDDNGECGNCIRVEETRKELKRKLEDYDTYASQELPSRLNHLGMSNREIRSDWDMVPTPIKKAMSKAVLQTLASGNYPKTGFGIGSNTGSGKTMALASLVKQFNKARYKLTFEHWLKNVRTGRYYGFDFDMKWVSWPDAVGFLRANAINGESEDFLVMAEKTPLLVLDDLGRERIKGSYVDDWAASQLDRIINYRYREELPILWTTNLMEEQLVSIYGMALVSRLTEDNPLYWIEGLPSMRIK